MFALGDAGRCNIRSQFGTGSRFTAECRARAAPDMEVRSQRCQVGPVTLGFLHATTPTQFRRSARHIADDRADLAVLWFVRCGSLVLDHGLRVGANELVLTRSLFPLRAQCLPDADGVHEVLYAVLDSGLLCETLGSEIRTDRIWPAERGPLAIAASLLADAFENDGMLHPDSAVRLVDTALQLVKQGLADQTATHALPPPANERLREILRFIDLQLTNPQLSRAMAAKRCGTSERYIATLLQRHGTSFSALVWQGRLERARAWLAAADGIERNIAEIAFALGFKSPAHFTRKFQRTYGMLPSVFRDDYASGKRSEAEARKQR